MGVLCPHLYFIRGAVRFHRLRRQLVGPGLLFDYLSDQIPAWRCPHCHGSQYIPSWQIPHLSHSVVQRVCICCELVKYIIVKYNVLGDPKTLPMDLLWTTASYFGGYRNCCSQGEGFPGHVISQLHVVWILGGTHRIHLTAWLLAGPPPSPLQQERLSSMHVHSRGLVYLNCLAGNAQWGIYFHSHDLFNVNLSDQTSEHQQMAWQQKIQLPRRGKFTPHTLKEMGKTLCHHSRERDSVPRSGGSGFSTSTVGRVGKPVRDHDLVTAQVSLPGWLGCL